MRFPVWRRGGTLLVAGVLALSGAREARAGKHDLNLLKLCDQRTPAPGTLNGQVPECSWVRRRADGVIDQVSVPAEAEARFRSLMSELGAVMAPRLVVPADTLGFAGFQIAGELGLTRIDNDASYWNAVETVPVENPAASRPDGWLTTLGVFLRKGIWIGLPAFEVGAGVLHLLDSNLLTWQGYAKLALHEGFANLPLPSLAVRGGVAYLTGTDQVRMTVTSLDVIASKSFGVQGTFRVEPYVAWSLLRIDADALPVDATPSCDAYRVRTAAAGQGLGDYCAEAQRGTDNDELANFVFPEQDAITRQRFSAGMKIKFATVFLTAQYDLTPGGTSRDEKRPDGAKDGSRRQDGVSLSAGFDF